MFEKKNIHLWGPADERPTTAKMAAAVGALVSYGSDSDSENESESRTSPQKVEPDSVAHLQPLKSNIITTLAALNSAPEVAVKVNKKRAAHSHKCSNLSTITVQLILRENSRVKCVYFRCPDAWSLNNSWNNVFFVCLFQEDVETGVHLDPALKEVTYNPTFETMFAPEVNIAICRDRWKHIVCFKYNIWNTIFIGVFNILDVRDHLCVRDPHAKI